MALENSSVTDPDRNRENNFRNVVENQFDLKFFDLRLEFSCFQRFPELSFRIDMLLLCSHEYGVCIRSIFVRLSL